MLAIITVTVTAIILNFALYKLYRRDLSGELEATKNRLRLIETVNFNLHSYCDNLEVNQSLLVAENRNLISRIRELEGRLRRVKGQQVLPGANFTDYYYRRSRMIAARYLRFHWNRGITSKVKL